MLCRESILCVHVCECERERCMSSICVRACMYGVYVCVRACMYVCMYIACVCLCVPCGWTEGGWVYRRWGVPCRWLYRVGGCGCTTWVRGAVYVWVCVWVYHVGVLRAVCVTWCVLRVGVCYVLMCVLCVVCAMCGVCYVCYVWCVLCVLCVVCAMCGVCYVWCVLCVGVRALCAPMDVCCILCMRVLYGCPICYEKYLKLLLFVLYVA